VRHPARARKFQLSRDFEQSRTRVVCLHTCEHDARAAEFTFPSQVNARRCVASLQTRVKLTIAAAHWRSTSTDLWLVAMDDAAALTDANDKRSIDMQVTLVSPSAFSRAQFFIAVSLSIDMATTVAPERRA
jgi:hypothetical protein